MTNAAPRPSSKRRLRLTTELGAVLVSLFAAGVATFQAWQSEESADAQLEAARRSAADQLVLVGEEASRPAGGFGESSTWGALGDEPTLVQNYGRLPVSNVVVEIYLLYSNGDARTVVVPIGVLPPCREAQIVEDSQEGRPVPLRGLDSVRLRVRFTDAAGHDWVRGTTGLPEAASDDKSRVAEKWDGFSRSDIRVIKTCVPA